MMDAEVSFLDRVEQIFHEALLEPAFETSEWLQLRCNGDPALVAEVASLLEHHRLATSEPHVSAPISPMAEVPNEMFGVYRPIRLIGRGGMSSVYLAERLDGLLDRNVALKVLGAHLAGAEFARRFQNEGQILAALRHPHITTVLDGGISASGHPYLAMEYVEGQSLDSYCDGHALDIQARLRLFLQVCDAVDYAHRNLILHRDLKPANILVTEGAHTGERIVKLLDFGTAALIAGGEEATATRARMLTPRYASPEYLRGERPGVAGDVFSLGVILYELLTGAWPFGKPDSVLSEFQRMVGDVSPAAPASALTAEASELRAQPQDRLRRTLAGDLSAIVLKALEYDPGRRYATVRELGADLERYLAGKPIEARPQTYAYRLGKFIRRRWLPVSAAALFVVGLSAAAAVAMLQARAANASARRTEVINQFFASMLSSAGNAPVFDPNSYTVAQLVEASEQRLEHQTGADELTLAILHRTLAQSLSNLSRFDQARRHMDRSLPVLRARGEERELAIALMVLGNIEDGQAHYDAGERAITESLVHLERLGSRADPDYLMNAKASLAIVLGFYTRKDPKRARQLMSEAIAIGNANPSLPRRQLAVAMGYSGGFLMEDRRFAEAETMLNNALATGRAEDPGGYWEMVPLLRLDSLARIRKNLPQAKAYAERMVDIAARSVGPNHPSVLIVRLNWADLAAQTGEVDRAVEVVNSAMPLIEKGFPAQSAEIWHDGMSASRVMRLAGRLDQAERYARESLNASRTWADSDARVADAWETLADVLLAEKKRADALTALDRAQTIYRKAGPAWQGNARVLDRRIAELRRQ
jgi:serine/threonine protein kinase